MSNNLIVKANDIVKASYHLTANEQRLILSAIAKIPKDKPISDRNTYLVSAEDFIELGVHPKTAYRELNKAIESLYEKNITIKQGNTSIKSRWVQMIVKADYDWLVENYHFFDSDCEKGDETYISMSFPQDYCLIGVKFSEAVIPFLSNLSSNFTQYLKQDIAGLSSAYAIRFYEFLMQFKSTGVVRITLTELRQMFDLDGKYKATKDLRKWVIDVAIKEINEKSPYEVKYRLTKTGRKYTHLEMRFKPKEDEEEKIGLTDKQLARVTRSKKFIDDYAHLVSSQSPENQSIDEWTATFVKKLKEEPKKFKKRPLKEYLDDEQAKRW